MNEKASHEVTDLNVKLSIQQIRDESPILTEMEKLKL